MQTVVVESPFAGDVARNIMYARACVRDCLKNGEAPFASHLLYTQEGVLDDLIPEDRKLGIEAGFFIGEALGSRRAYIDFGISSGMKHGMEHAEKIGQRIIMRNLPAEELKKILDYFSTRCSVCADPLSETAIHVASVLGVSWTRCQKCSPVPPPPL